MAKRPVFIVLNKFPFVGIIETEFVYYSGFSYAQSRKSINSLHSRFLFNHPEFQKSILEVSTRSDNDLGIFLSAFNLKYSFSQGKEYSVENVFQAGKCFENNRQYLEVLEMSASEAKKYPLLRSSGEITHFKLGETIFPRVPITLFYDWIYTNALYQNRKLAIEAEKYQAFTDIAFNPQKSLNCQARSVALFVALAKANLIKEAIQSPDIFCAIVFRNNNTTGKKKDTEIEQLSMF